MTIAAGFVCLDGVVLCADTQESIPSYTKNESEKIKIWDWDDPDFAIAIAGSGETELVETASNYIIEAARSPDPQLNKIHSAIQAEYLDFFNTHIVPYATAYPQGEPPYIDMLIAVRGKDDQGLFKITGNTVRQIEYNAECIGSGVILARSLIETWYSADLHLDELVIIAIYILFQAKKFADGCGGGTDLFVLSRDRKGRSGFISGVKIKEIEECLSGFSSSTRQLLTDLANPNVSQRGFEQSLRYARNRLMRHREKLKSCNDLFLHDIASWKKKKSR